MFDLRMPDVNNVLIAGNLTRDPTFRKTTNGTPVANFWIASNRRFKDNNGQWRENVCYVGVVAWYKLAENCAENLKKGNAVIVEGELQSRSLRMDDGRNRNIVEIKARRVQFLNRTNEENENGREYSSFEDDGFRVIKKSTPVEKIEKKVEEKDQGNPLTGKYDYGYQEVKL